MGDSLLDVAGAEPAWGPAQRPRTMPHPPEWRRAELDPLPDAEDALAWTLWLGLRRIRDWADTPPDERAAFFALAVLDGRGGSDTARAARWASARAEAPELEEALTSLARLWSAPAQVEAVELADACDAVAQWAERRALNETALQFAEAAAALEPKSPKRANLAGRACRIGGAWSRADAWYQRGLGMARQQNSRVELFRGNLGAGAVAYLQGRYRSAHDFFVSGAWKARDMGKLPLAARAQHDLMLLAVELGKFGKSLTHAQRALHWYPMHHPRIPYLVHDFAYLLTRVRHEAAALEVLENVRPMIPAEHESLLVWGTVARAAGGSGDAKLFASAKAQVQQLAKRYSQHAAHSLYEVAAGARLLDLWDVCEHFASAALATALAQGRGDTEQDAKRLLLAVASRLPLAQREFLGTSQQFEVARLMDDYLRRAAKWRPRPQKAAGRPAPLRADP